MTEGIKQMPLIYMSFSRKIKKSTEYVSCSTQQSDFKCLVDRLPCVYFSDVYATKLSPTCATSRTPSQDLLKYLLVRLERRGYPLLAIHDTIKQASGSSKAADWHLDHFCHLI